MKEEGIEALKDWRGVPINIGDTVVYGAGQGRSISLVEATVKGFTANGRVILDVVRESYGYREGKPVNVGADRLTVVEKLASSSVPTHREKKIKSKTNLLERYREDVALLAEGEPVSPEWRNNREYYTLEYVQERVRELETEIAELRAQ